MKKALLFLVAMLILVLACAQFLSAWLVNRHEEEVLSVLAVQLKSNISVVQVKGTGPWRSVRYLSIPARTYDNSELRQIVFACDELNNLLAIKGVVRDSDQKTIRQFGLNQRVSFAVSIGGPAIEWITIRCR